MSVPKPSECDCSTWIANSASVRQGYRICLPVDGAAQKLSKSANKSARCRCRMSRDLSIYAHSPVAIRNIPHFDLSLLEYGRRGNSPLGDIGHCFTILTQSPNAAAANSSFLRNQGRRFCLNPTIKALVLLIRLAADASNPPSTEFDRKTQSTFL